MKKPLGDEAVTAQAMTEMKLFPREIAIYENIVPKIEKLFKIQGKSIKLSPKYYSNPEQSIILEDLKEKQFTNADRIKGLDLNHCKSVLTQMARFHAGSAVVFEQNGHFKDIFTKGVFTEDNRDYIEGFNKSLYSVLQQCMESSYRNGRIQWNYKSNYKYK